MQDDTLFACRVSAFGNLRVEAYLQLTAAYRSLSRPTSAPDAKASSLRPLSLDLSVKLENYASHFGILRNYIFTHSNLDVPQFLFVFLYALLALYRIFVIQFSRCGEHRSAQREYPLN